MRNGLIAISATAAAATATAATTAAKLATRTAAATATAAAFFTRAGDVYGQITTIEGSAIHGLDGLLSFLFSAHGYETETARTTAHAIDHQVCLDDGAVSGKRVLQIVFGGVEGNVSYKQFIIAHVMLTVARLTFLSLKLIPTAGFKIITELEFT